MRPAILLALAGWLGASPLQPDAVPADTLIALERTVCFGTCPAYTVSIDAAGNVTYEGKKFVRISGQQRSRIPVNRVAELWETVARIQFFTLDEDYSSIRQPDGTEMFVTDLPSTIVTVTAGGRRKQVRDYLGAPIGLRDFEEQIDEAANTRQWVRIDEATVNALARSGRLPDTKQQAEWLITALRYDEVGVVNALLDGGLRPATVFAAGKMVPLMWARSGAAARALVAAGADPRQKDAGGATRLGVAAHAPVDVTKALLEAGVRPDEGADYIGQRPLHAAACAGNAGVVELLLAAGADPGRRAPNGESPLQCAQRGKRNDEVTPRVPFERLPLFLPDFNRVITLLQQRVTSPQ